MIRKYHPERSTVTLMCLNCWLSVRQVINIPGATMRTNENNLSKTSLKRLRFLEIPNTALNKPRNIEISKNVCPRTHVEIPHQRIHLHSRSPSVSTVSLVDSIDPIVRKSTRIRNQLT
jgi:hypothetical protein